MFNDFPGKIDRTTQSSTALNAAFANTADEAEEAKVKVKGLKEILDEMTDANLDAYEAETQATAAIREATEAINKNGRSIDVNTKRGQKNRETLASLATAFNRTTTANDKANVSATKSARDFDRQRREFIRAAQAAGYTAGQAQNLANKVLKIPRSRVIDIRAYTGSAEAKIQAIKDSLRRMPGSKTITIRTIADIPAGMSIGQLMREHGGPVRKGQAYIVGEKRPEVFVPDRDGEIIPSIEQFSNAGGASGQMARGRAWHSGPGRGGSQVLRLDLRGEREIVALFRRLIRSANLLQLEAAA
jgi:hypothetical protein